MRHGEPDDYTIGEASSWLYQDSLLAFHFAPTCIGHICGVSRHFVPVPRGRSWGARIVGADWVEAERKSAQYLTAGLTTDRHKWPERTVHVDLAAVTAAFAGLEGQTLVAVYFGIPEEVLSPTLKDDGDTVHVETGMAVHNQDWQRQGIFRKTRYLSSPGNGNFQLDLLPALYHFALHARSLQTPHIGTLRFEYEPRSFRGRGFKMSDLLLADRIVDLRGSNALAREDMIVDVNLTGTFDVASTVFVYFELYDLAPTPNDVHRYSVAYSVRPEDGAEEVVTLGIGEQQASAPSLIEYVGIDISEVPLGKYQLEVSVTELQSGRTIARTRPLVVVR